MGSPFAYLWEILTFATMEMLMTMPRHKKRIVIFKRCTSDVSFNLEETRRM